DLLQRGFESGLVGGATAQHFTGGRCARGGVIQRSVRVDGHGRGSGHVTRMCRCLYPVGGRCTTPRFADSTVPYPARPQRAALELAARPTRSGSAGGGWAGEVPATPPAPGRSERSGTVPPPPR